MVILCSIIDSGISAAAMPGYILLRLWELSWERMGRLRALDIISKHSRYILVEMIVIDIG